WGLGAGQPATDAPPAERPTAPPPERPTAPPAERPTAPPPERPTALPATCPLPPAMQPGSPAPLSEGGEDLARESLPPATGHLPPTAQPGDDRAALELIRQAIPRRRALHLHYQPDDGPASVRWVQPLALERHGGRWLLHAYCMERQAERCFRVDRIRQISSAGLRPPTPHDRRQPARAPRRPPPAPRTGFFAPPPTPPPGSPLVRVWLE
ncbi:WYL domain-containing protein, partial [Oscillochloris sp. ZM17-4]|uniref:helix-turn-helix transcriptional regulator n=1 Tax=Oscillochloris sp. ZM17-4 TaxID=2866714 RepID=UPI001C735056